MPRHQRHRRARPVHPRRLWPVRVGCAAAVAGVVVLARCVPVQVAAPPDPGVCAAVEAFLATAFIGIGPHPGATPEDEDATARANAQLSRMAAELRELPQIKEMSCWVTTTGR